MATVFAVLAIPKERTYAQFCTLGCSVPVPYFQKSSEYIATRSKGIVVMGMECAELLIAMDLAYILMHCTCQRYWLEFSKCLLSLSFYFSRKIEGVSPFRSGFCMGWGHGVSF